jgi:hypothetical protein
VRHDPAVNHAIDGKAKRCARRDVDQMVLMG